jgi:hypothetical protein
MNFLHRFTRTALAVERHCGLGPVSEELCKIRRQEHQTGIDAIDATQVAGAVIADLLDVSRITHGQVAPGMTSVDFVELIRHSVAFRTEFRTR